MRILLKANTLFFRIILLLGFIILISFFLNGCKIEKKSFNNLTFISINQNGFYLNDSLFFPLTLNYIVDLQYGGGNLWASPANGYDSVKGHYYTSKDSCLMQLKKDMELIKKMGFNSVRIVRVGEVNINPKNGELSVIANFKNKRDTTIVLSNSFWLRKNDSYNNYFTAIEEMLGIIDSAGLKVVFLTRMSIEFNSTETFLKNLVSYFKKSSTIMAYDFFNEPLYFDRKDRLKITVYSKVNHWQKIITTRAPNHLSTIGLEGVREVFEWDPNILNVDFISYHPYEHEPEQVRNELYWYGKYTNKPWIVGETGWYTSKKNERDSLKTQKSFAIKTLEQSYNCGAKGYSWWQFKDVAWNDLKNHSDLMGLVSKNGNTKKAIRVFQDFDPTKKKGDCLCLDNYYNYSESTSFLLRGKLVDGENFPIEGGIILGWSKQWTDSYHTITKKDGTFELKGSFPFYHWMASSIKHEMIRGDIIADTITSNPPIFDLRILTVNQLDFLE